MNKKKVIYDDTKKGTEGRKVVRLFDPKPAPEWSKRSKGILMPTTKPKPSQKIVEDAIAKRDKICESTRKEVAEDTHYLIKNLCLKADKELMKYFELETAFNLKKHKLEVKRNESIRSLTSRHHNRLSKTRKSDSYLSANKYINEIVLKKLNEIKSKMIKDMRNKYGNAITNLVLADMRNNFISMWEFPLTKNKALDKTLDQFDVQFEKLAKQKAEEVKVPSVSCQDLTYSIDQDSEILKLR